MENQTKPSTTSVDEKTDSRVDRCGRCKEAQRRCRCQPRCPDRFHEGNRFSWRDLNSEYQVYSMGLKHWAMCSTQARAKIVTEALERLYQD